MLAVLTVMAGAFCSQSVMAQSASSAKSCSQQTCCKAKSCQKKCAAGNATSRVLEISNMLSGSDVFQQIVSSGASVLSYTSQDPLRPRKHGLP